MGGAFALHIGKKHLKTPSARRGVGFEVFRGPEYNSDSNPDGIDSTRTHLNIALVKPRGGNLDFAVEERIKAGYKGTKALRKDAVKCFEFVISGDHDLMMRQSGVPYLKHALTWVQEYIGKDNVVGACIHLDETTPHLHVHVVPLTPDGRLSAFELMGGDGAVGRKKLQNMRNNFYLNVAERYGFNRGEVYNLEKKPPGHEDESKKHKPTKEYKKHMKEVKELAAAAAAEDKDFVHEIRLRARKKKWGGQTVKEVKLTPDEVERLADGYEINAESIREFKDELETENKRLLKKIKEQADTINKMSEEWPRLKGYEKDFKIYQSRETQYRDVCYHRDKLLERSNELDKKVAAYEKMAPNLKNAYDRQKRVGLA